MPNPSRPQVVELSARLLALAATIALGFGNLGANPLPSAQPALDAAGHETPAAAAMDAIARAFRAGRADVLTSILPSEGKVFLSLSTVGDQAGYYGRDQVYFIFERIFSRYRTVAFSIRIQGPAKAGGRGEGSGLTYCVSTWSYARQGGHDGETRFHFVLSTKSGRTALVQIREAQ